MVEETLCDISGNPILTPKNIAQDNLIKIESLITNVTSTGSSTRTESEDFWLFLACFWPNLTAFVVEEIFS